MKFISSFLYALIISFLSTYTSLCIKLKETSRLSNIQLYLSNTTSPTQFRAHIMLDEQNRGIIISPSIYNSPEKYLRLVGEKQEGYEDTFLIDFRLFRSCDLPISFSDADGTNLNILISPFSLENRNKNSNLTINIELINYQQTFPNKKLTEVKDILKQYCLSRKNEINTYKTQFLDNYKLLLSHKANISKLNALLNEEETKLLKYNSTISNAKNQLHSIQLLNNSYTVQLNSLKSINKGSVNLINDSQSKINELTDDLHKIEGNIINTNDKIDLNDNNIQQHKKEMHTFLVAYQQYENELLTNKKNISVIENDISNLNLKQMRIDLELKEEKSKLNQTEQAINEHNTQILKIQNELYNLTNSISNIKNENIIIQQNINQHKTKMSQIENQITSLLQMKSSLQDDIHKQFNLLISNENKIISMTNQTDNMQTELRRLQNETKILLNNDKVNYINNISLFKNESTNITNMKDVKNKMLLQLQDKMNNNLHSKTELDMKIHNVNVTINKLNDTNEKLKREMTFALNEKNNIMKQIKDKENKIMNLKGEINDYMNDINTIIKKVGTAEQNMKTLMSIVDEYQHIKQPYESNIMKINQEKNEVESKYKEAIYDLKRISNVLKNNTKSARIVIELAEDEIFNNNNTTINNGNKIEAIISKIIS